MKKETIVLVHGIWEFSFNLWYWGFHLRKAGYRIEYLKYHSVIDDLTLNTKKLARLVEKIGASPLHLVGHSMGGLIVLNYLENNSGHNIQSSVVLGSPVNGSIVAREMGNTWFGKILFGSNLDLLSKGLVLLRQHDVGVVSGIAGKGLGRIFADLPTPHDGAVSKQETLFDGVSDAICLQTSHSTMLLSRKVVSEIIEFLENGQFSLINKDIAGVEK